MDLDFPLILMVATVVTGVLALADKIWLAPKRLVLVNELRDGNASEEQLEKAAAEPFLIEQGKSFFPVLALVFVLRSFIVEPFQIPSGSMEPGLIKGDFILVSKFSYDLRMPVFGNTLLETGDPQRGDVMVFFPPNDERYFIKRVIGLAGDHIVFRDRTLTINGVEIKAEDVAGEPAYNPQKFIGSEALGEHQAQIQWVVARNRNGEKVVWAGPEGEWTVPQGHYFMMGDNRGNSHDSRGWGFVPEENVVGKAVAVWMHWENWSDIPSFGRNGWIE